MSDLNLEGKPFCRYLRTKKMYIPMSAAGDPRDETETAHYWCLKTQMALGPDNEPAKGRECRPGRPCWESEF